MTGTCETCTHWHSNNKECHINPPGITFNNEAEGSIMGNGWPNTDKDDWCGKYFHIKQIDKDTRRSIKGRPGWGDKQ